jgi:hypothetical protein
VRVEAFDAARREAFGGARQERAGRVGVARRPALERGPEGDPAVEPGIADQAGERVDGVGAVDGPVARRRRGGRGRCRCRLGVGEAREAVGRGRGAHLVILEHGVVAEVREQRLGGGRDHEVGP